MGTISQKNYSVYQNSKFQEASNVVMASENACHKNCIHSYLLIEADVVNKTKMCEAASTCIYVFESDKHPVNGLAYIFSGRVIDDAVVNAHNSVEIGTTQWLDYEGGASWIL